ncbi:TniQ family protein [Clostridium diolis]|uniref:TniQ family protein n=1 Tax=Clostridium diolis TaxID=223919 RepID=UPI003AF9CF2B
MEDKLTVRFKPFKDELLTSYLVRLSKNNGIDLLRLLNSIKEIKDDYIQLSELSVIDKIPFKHINYNALEKLLGFRIDFLLTNSFYNIIEKFGDSSEVERARFISGVIRKDCYYCPKCLEEKMYYRLIWKIEGITNCAKHKCKLLNKCPHCNHKIKYEEITCLGICSNCGGKLSGDIEKNVENVNYSLYQTYLYESWNKLMYSNYNKMRSQEIAYKILYILNKKRSIFDKDLLNNLNKGKYFLQMILQYARGTTINRKTLHISSIINILFENKISIDDFLKLQVPKEFVVSIKDKKQNKLERISCMAPWCKNYKVNGGLVKTNTTYRKLVNNSALLYYMYCPECGCEYAYDENGYLVERTSFIDGFNRLNNTWNNTMSLENSAYINSMTEDKVKRVLAYFNTRGMYLKDEKTIILEEKLINLFIKEIEMGSNLNKIKNLKCWSGYREFLLYRFQKEVMLELNMKKVVRNKIVNIENKRQKVINILEELSKDDIPITLNKVCSKLNIYPETIRYWKCNKLISDYKTKQKDNYMQRNRKVIKEKIRLFIGDNKDNFIRTKELYKYVGIQRNILWRKYPEITAYITSEISRHNKLMQK